MTLVLLYAAVGDMQYRLMARDLGTDLLADGCQAPVTAITTEREPSYTRGGTSQLIMETGSFTTQEGWEISTEPLLGTHSDVEDFDRGELVMLYRCDAPYEALSPAAAERVTGLLWFGDKALPLAIAVVVWVLAIRWWRANG